MKTGTRHQIVTFDRSKSGNEKWAPAAANRSVEATKPIVSPKSLAAAVIDPNTITLGGSDPGTWTASVERLNKLSGQKVKFQLGNLEPKIMTFESAEIQANGRQLKISFADSSPYLIYSNMTHSKALLHITPLTSNLIALDTEPDARFVLNLSNVSLNLISMWNHQGGAITERSKSVEELADLYVGRPVRLTKMTADGRVDNGQVQEGILTKLYTSDEDVNLEIDGKLALYLSPHNSDDISKSIAVEVFKDGHRFEGK